MDILPGPNFDRLNNIPVEMKGNIPTPPCETFQGMKLKRQLASLLVSNNYKTPTAIQKYVIPAIADSRDVLVCSPTGTGKTAAFLVPIIDKLLKNWMDPIIEDDIDGITCFPQVLIISPSRELAIQTLEMCKKLTQNTMIVALPAYGGINTGDQIADLSGRGAHIIVATPGRLEHFLRIGCINFSKIRFLVLDEADRILQTGLGKTTYRVIYHHTMKPKGTRHTLLFSATYPKEFQKLAKDILTNYLFICMGEVNAPNADIEERFFEVRGNKGQKLLQLLREEEEANGPQRTLIFVNTITTTERLARFLETNHYVVEIMSGYIKQKDREIILRDFKNNDFQILITTDVCARGLNIKGLDHVINYDLPWSIPEYVNRIGRTGRMGNTGVATSFFQPGRGADERIGPHLVYCLGYTQKEVPPFLLKYLKGDTAVRAAGRNYYRRKF